MKIVLEKKGWEWVAYFVFGTEPGATQEVGETPQHALEKLLSSLKGK